MPQPADTGACCSRLARVHAGAGQRHDGYVGRIEGRAGIELVCADPGRYANTFAELGEIKHRTEHSAVKWGTNVGICRVAYAEHAADIENLNAVANVQCAWQVTRVSS